jgi:flagellar assembly protein FliH
MLSRILEKGEVERANKIEWPSVTGVPQPPRAGGPIGGRDAWQPSRARSPQADREADERLRQSYESGFQAGLEAARKEVAAEVEPELKRLAESIAGVAGARPQVMQQAGTDLVKLSTEIARRILNRELTIDRGAIEGLVKVALDKLQGQEVYRVRIRPEYEKPVRAHLERAGRFSQVEIVVDPAQQRGGVVFEISRGTLDASIDTKLREIEQGLVDRFLSA